MVDFLLKVYSQDESLTPYDINSNPSVYAELGEETVSDFKTVRDSVRAVRENKESSSSFEVKVRKAAEADFSVTKKLKGDTVIFEDNDIRYHTYALEREYVTKAFMNYAKDIVRGFYLRNEVQNFALMNDLNRNLDGFTDDDGDTIDPQFDHVEQDENIIIEKDILNARAIARRELPTLLITLETVSIKIGADLIKLLKVAQSIQRETGRDDLSKTSGSVIHSSRSDYFIPSVNRKGIRKEVTVTNSKPNGQIVTKILIGQPWTTQAQNDVLSDKSVIEVFHKALRLLNNGDIRLTDEDVEFIPKKEYQEYLRSKVIKMKTSKNLKEKIREISSILDAEIINQYEFDALINNSVKNKLSGFALIENELDKLGDCGVVRKYFNAGVNNLEFIANEISKAYNERLGMLSKRGLNPIYVDNILRSLHGKLYNVKDLYLGFVAEKSNGRVKPLKVPMNWLMHSHDGLEELKHLDYIGYIHVSGTFVCLVDNQIFVMPVESVLQHLNVLKYSLNPMTREASESIIKNNSLYGRSWERLDEVRL